MSKRKEYNGHPSYNHWAVAVYVLNDEGVYNYAVEVSREEFEDDMAGRKTPDGILISKSTARAAWNIVHNIRG